MGIVSTNSYDLPVLDNSNLEDVYDEIELSGFPLSWSPFQLIETRNWPQTTIEDLQHNPGKIVKMLGYYVCTKDVMTVKKEWMAFGHFIDAAGDYLDTVHFPDSLRKHPFRGLGVYLMEGKVTEEFGVYALEVHRQVKVPYVQDPRY